MGGTMQIKPLRDLILIRIEKQKDETTSSGIFMPKDAWNDTEPYGTIEAVGDDVKSFKKGDKVYVNIYAMLDLAGVDKELKMIKECDVLAYVQ